MNMATVDRFFDRRAAGAEPPRFGESQVRSLSDLQSLLSRTYAGLRAVNEGPAVAPMVDDLVNGLADFRAHSTTDAWKSIVERLRKHPVLELMHQDPYTHRGYHKPRGYAADAVMLDFIYRHPAGEPLRRTGVDRHLGGGFFRLDRNTSAAAHFLGDCLAQLR